jgi:hypothetical protein
MARKTRLRSLLADQRGNVLALAAVGLPLLMGCAGLAVDTVQWVLAKRQIQETADGAAIAAVHALIQGVDPETEVVRFLEKDGDLPPEAAVDAESSPEGHRDDPYAVSVRVTVPTSTSFASLFLGGPVTVTAEAVATVVEAGEYCALALGDTDKPGLELAPSTNVEADCGFATNASSTQSITADASSSFAAERLLSFGGTDADKALEGSAVRTYGLKQDDPFENTEPPAIPSTGCPNATVNPGGSGEIMLQPGCYGNMVINGKARLAPGVYILNRGNLLVGATGNLTCRGCAIFLTSDSASVDPASVGKVRIDEHATVKLSAPADGPYAGILLYQDRRVLSDLDGYENQIGGSSFSKLEGLLYFPSDTLRINARMAPDFGCTRLIGRRIVIDGRLLIAKSCGLSGKINFAATEVRLVR